MEIVTKKISDLVLNKKNPRVNDAAAERLDFIPGNMYIEGTKTKRKSSWMPSRFLSINQFTGIDIMTDPKVSKQTQKSKMVIYKITNKINGKIYIGLTTTPIKRRIAAHVRKSKLSNAGGVSGAIKKYGFDNFSVSVIDTAKNLDELNQKEKHYIKSMASLSPNGYNLHTGGDSHRCSQETKKKLSLSASKRRMSKETRKRMSESGKLKIFTEETRARMSKALKGRKHSAEHVANLPQNQKFFHDGDKHPRALLKNKQVLKIKKMLSDGITNKAISEVFGITQGHVSMIKTGRAYKYV